MTLKPPLYPTKRIRALYDEGRIDRPVLIACQSAHPPMITVGDVLDWLVERGSFADVPGCRRQGRISRILAEMAENASEPPPGYEGNAEDIPFGFVDAGRRAGYETYRVEHGHYPMFRILADFLAGPEASRDDLIFGMAIGLTGPRPRSMDEIAHFFDLTRERIRQILAAYEMPPRIGPTQRWHLYCDHSTYFINEKSEKFIHVRDTEIDTLTFGTYAAMLTRTVMLEDVDGRYLVRRGWKKELTAWVKRLERLASQPRAIESRISLDGLTMAGTLDPRMRLVVLNQIAPALGIGVEPPDLLVFSR